MMTLLRKSFMVFVVGIVFYSCNSDKVELTIEREKLVGVLADLHVAEEMLGKFREQEKDSVRNALLTDISIIHQVDTARIFANVRILQNDPKLGLDIYNDVYEKLASYAESNKPQKKKESKSPDLNKTTVDSLTKTKE